MPVPLGTTGRARSHSPGALGLSLQHSSGKLRGLVQQLRRAGSGSKSSHSDSGHDDGWAVAVGPHAMEPWQRARAQQRWRMVRVQARHVVLATRWHRDVNRPYKRLWLAFKSSHTLVAGLFFRGASGQLLPRLSRAQTVQILLNSLALELVVLCMLLSAPTDGPLVINPVKIVASGALAATICIPGTMLSAALFSPVQLIKALRRLLCCTLKAPYRSVVACTRCVSCLVRGVCCCGGTAAAARSARVAPMPASSARFDDATRLRGNLDADEDDEEDAAAEGGGGAVRGRSRGRRYSYASLETYMVQASLRRSLASHSWRHALPLAIGWLTNWLLLISLMAIVSAYGCEFYGALAEGRRGEAFLLAWGWSVGQRFLVNEPALILVQKGLPMLFASVACEHVFSESCVAVLGLIVEGIATLMRSLRAATAA